MTQTTTRRAVLAGIATAPALSAPALASHVGDPRLRELWAQYLEYLAVELAAHAATESARAAYDAEEPPCPPNVLDWHSPAHRSLWEKHGLDRLYDAWNDAGERTDATVKAILEQEAEGLFGVGAKLAALPTQEGQDSSYEHERAIRSALTDIDRLIGTTFLAAFALTSNTSVDDDIDEDDDDDEDEAVS